MPLSAPQTDTLEVIAKSLAEINQQLKTIKTTSDFNETLKTIGLITTPLLSTLITGYIFFRLTKSKEIRFKKNDLSGEIYGSVFELRHIGVVGTINSIHTKGFFRLMELLNDPYFHGPMVHPDELCSYTSEKALKQFNEFQVKLTQSVEKSTEQMRVLRKYVGQYKQYLDEKQTKEFDELMKPVSQMFLEDYDLSTCKTPAECEKRMNELSQSCGKIFMEKHTPHIQKLFKFLDKNK